MDLITGLGPTFAKKIITKPMHVSSAQLTMLYLLGPAITLGDTAEQMTPSCL